MGINKEQFTARFELEVLDPLKENMGKLGNKVPATTVIELWDTYLDICKDSKDITEHQSNTWVVPKNLLKE